MGADYIVDFYIEIKYMTKWNKKNHIVRHFYDSTCHWFEEDDNDNYDNDDYYGHIHASAGQHYQNNLVANSIIYNNDKWLIDHDGNSTEDGAKFHIDHDDINMCFCLSVSKYDKPLGKCKICSFSNSVLLAVNKDILRKIQDNKSEFLHNFDKNKITTKSKESFSRMGYYTEPNNFWNNIQIVNLRTTFDARRR